MSVGDYPPGAANDTRAPYNQSATESDRKEFTLHVSVTLEKDVTIVTDDWAGDYTTYDGEYIPAEYVGDFKADFEAQHEGLLTILTHYVEYAKGSLKRNKELIKAMGPCAYSNALKRENAILSLRIEDAQGWMGESIELF